MNWLMVRRSVFSSVILLWLAFASGHVFAVDILLAEPPQPVSEKQLETVCAGREPWHTKGTINVRADNDMFGAQGQDQGYTNGVLVSWVSPNLVDYRQDPCIPKFLRTFNQYIDWLQPSGYDEQNMIFGLSQLMYTPKYREAQPYDPSDRPYAGALLLSVGYNAREDDFLRTTQVRFGLVGPASYARESQRIVHRMRGLYQFEHWDRQLRNEPVIQIIHERRKRLLRLQNAADWGWDITRHYGGSVGNFATYANVGAEFRLGLRLPDDFGTAALRPAGENTSPVRLQNTGRWSAHVFLGLDARWVFHDITLDGNTFQSSYSVDKRDVVADMALGAALYWDKWRMAVARYYRTAEFYGQIEKPIYGAITVGRRF